MNGQNNRDMRSSSAQRPAGMRTQGSSAQNSRQRPMGMNTQRPAQRPQGVNPQRPAQRPQGVNPQRPAQRPQGMNPPRPDARARQAGGARASQNPPRRQPPKRGSAGKKILNVLMKVFAGIAFVFYAIIKGIGKLFSLISRPFDVFRKDETSTAIVNTLLGGVVVIILLCVMLACKSSINSVRAHSLAARGDADAAVRIVKELEADGYAPEKLEKTRVSVAEGLIKGGKYSEAAELISGMAEGSTRTNLTRRNNYANAVQLYDKGDYTAAAQLFYQMEDYEDSALRYADCRCALAIEAWQEGNESSARSLLLDVPDVVERVNRAARKVAGSEAGAQAILSAELFSERNLNEIEHTMEELAAARSDMPEGRIAAGRYHTVALTSGGTVLFAGDNSLGQGNVSGWNGITQVAAGAFHTVALRSDGTVLATGNNSEGQCDVTGWTDIVAVSAGTASTIGLKSDGSVVACGMHSDLVSGWHGATFVTAGSYSMGCLYDKGSMLSSHKGAQMDMGAVLYDLSVCGQVSVGVLYDGTLISSFDGAPQWDGIVSATAFESGILAIGVDGQVRTHFYRPGAAVEISVPGNAVEVESSGTHHVVLTEDGKVYAFGENDYGQCNVSGWQL